MPTKDNFPSFHDLGSECSPCSLVYALPVTMLDLAFYKESNLPTISQLEWTWVLWEVPIQRAKSHGCLQTDPHPGMKLSNLQLWNLGASQAAQG